MGNVLMVGKKNTDFSK